MERFYRPPANCQVPELGEKWEVVFGRRTCGYFVEVGAYDGENFSNTSCLADLGWAGLYIEPIAEFAGKCRERHADNAAVSIVEIAVSDKAGTAEIFLGDTLTTLVAEQVDDYERIDWAKGLHRGAHRTITTETLDTILVGADAPIGFDLLVVDVEGAEDQVFAGFDVLHWQPKALLVELEDEHPDFKHNPRVVRAVRRIREKLAAAGYQVFYKDDINSLYLRSDVYERTQTRKSQGRKVPAVSIGMPVYNRPTLLKEALGSILAQTYDNFEVIISDNHSPSDELKKLCVDLTENDPRFIYFRQKENIGAGNNFLWVLSRATSNYFMWASDDDTWYPSFLSSALNRLNNSPKMGGWMCHLSVVHPEDSSVVIREVPNLARFNSGFFKWLDLSKYVGEPEVLGKANLIYGVFRRTALAAAIEASRCFIGQWGDDMVLVYAFLCRNKMIVEPKVLFNKRAALADIGFNPDNPRKYVVPWQEARKFYGALVSVSRRTPNFVFTCSAVVVRYLYDVFYSRIILKRKAPWLPPWTAGR